ncbi:MARVEL domain-containing protein 1 [Callorhinchus milii]|uniref:MARVEL domain containing 1 n=1 Tax=Callorhinchus milii TaxID=7868 RepID=A0A4W3IU87_CALMI|nr:MARVEL domain-containing protein 1 [Callorhinchus milii]|eukprot:gi/632985195/ref/XP_007909544.1/ PREDICTED: MARVEL domain-containing protein 1 [Callorhinchus milii]
MENRKDKAFLKSPLGVLRLSHILLDALVWITIASRRYEGAVHFAVFVAVLFWLTALALFICTLLGKSELVPCLGAERWLLTNTWHDGLATLGHLVACGVMVYKTKEKNFCNVTAYSFSCLYSLYLTATVFLALCAFLYLLSAIYSAYKASQGHTSLF